MTGTQQADLPNGWELADLRAIAEVNPKLDKSAHADSLKVSFVPMSAVEAKTGSIDVSQTRRVEEVKKGYTPFREGDVLFAKITPCMENGKMAVVPALTNGLGFGSTEFHVLRPRRGISAEYIYYFVSSEHFRRDAEHNMTGAVGQRRVPTPYLAEQLVPLPPELEQRRIVATIENLFSALDKGIESLRTAREQLKVYRQAALKHAFEGRLTAEWREARSEGLESGDELRKRLLIRRRDEWERAERRRFEKKGSVPAKDGWKKRYKEPRPIDADGLPALPEGWCWAALEELVSGKPRSLQSGPFGSNLKHSEFQDYGVLVLGIDNVRDGRFSVGSGNRISEKRFRELQKYEARPGDLLITVMASLGRTCIVPRDLETAIITKHLYRVSMEPDLLFPEFFNLLLQSETVSRQRMFNNAQGQTRPGLNSSILRTLPVPLCSFEEQQEIVNRVEAELERIARLDVLIGNEITRCTGLRQSILKKAFRGHLVAQYASDEPASALLEKIKAEREEAGMNGKTTRKKRKAGT